MEKISTCPEGCKAITMIKHEPESERIKRVQAEFLAHHNKWKKEQAKLKKRKAKVNAELKEINKVERIINLIKFNK